MSGVGTAACSSDYFKFRKIEFGGIRFKLWGLQQTNQAKVGKFPLDSLIRWKTIDGWKRAMRLSGLFLQWMMERQHKKKWTCLRQRGQPEASAGTTGYLLSSKSQRQASASFTADRSVGLQWPIITFRHNKQIKRKWFTIFINENCQLVSQSSDWF